MKKDLPLTKFKAANQLTANHRKFLILKKENRQNYNAIKKACNTQINFIRGKTQKNNLKGRSFFSEAL